ncbi:TRAP transporter small permease subunit [Desulforhopalus singaporensis]|nr:TRAP transporter small permease subunit [Desulforhopalus singaporensis]
MESLSQTPIYTQSKNTTIGESDKDWPHGEVRTVRKLLSSTVNTIDAISNWSGKVLALFLLVMIAITMYEVIARYVFSRPTTWALEATTMIFGTYMICSLAYSLLSKAHVSMDIFYSKWSDRTRAIVDLCTFPLVTIFIGLILWQSTVYGIESVQIREHAATVWSPPLYPWKMTIPFGMLLLLLQHISDFIRNLVLAITGEELQ